MSNNRTQVTTGSLLGIRAGLKEPTITPDLIRKQYGDNQFITDLLEGMGESNYTCPEFQDARLTKITVDDIPKTSGTPASQVGHLRRLMDSIIHTYTSLPSLRESADALLCKLSSMKSTLVTFSRDTVIANVLKGSDPLTRLLFERAVENHPYLKTLSNVDKIHTLQVILHTINIAILLINLVIMFTQTTNKAVIALQFGSIITSITLFLVELYSKQKVIPKSFNIQDMITELLQSKMESQFVSRFDSRRNQILVDLFTNYGKRFDLPDEIINIAKDKLSSQTSDIITCPQSSQYFDYAIAVAEKTSNLLAKYPFIRTANVINRLPFDPQIGDGLHNAFSHFTCIQNLSPDILKEINLMESDWIYWKFVIHSIKEQTPYKDFTIEGFPTLNHQFASLGNEGWSVHKIQGEDENSILPSIGKAACALLALVSAGLTTLTGKGSFTDCFKKVKGFVKDWKDSKSLITGCKAAFIGLVYDMFGWDIGNLHAIKKHAKEIQQQLIHCSTISPHTLSANPILRSKVELYQTEATQILLDLKNYDSEDLKDMIRDLSILMSSVAKILADSQTFDDSDSLRPIPVALYLSGHAGSGKTHFIQHILGPYLNQKLNLSLPAQFSVDASGHFNSINPLKADHLFSDEIAVKIDDPLVNCLNQLISETVFMAPGAFNKDVKLAPKLISLCNNEDEIQNASSRAKFLRALTSRLTQFEVIHNEFNPELSQDRNSLTRMANMENVAFYRVKTDIQGKSTKTSQRMTALEVCELVYSEIVREQEAYKQKILKRVSYTCPTQGPFEFSLLEFSKTDTVYKTYVDREMHPLFHKTKSFKSPHDLYPLSQYLGLQICIHSDNTYQRIGSGVDTLCCEMRETNNVLDFFSNKRIQSAQSFINSEKQTLYLHIIGKPGVGKTRLLKSKISELAEITGFETFYATAFSLDVIKRDVVAAKSPIILILDDVITLKPFDFQGLYDHIPSGSIVIMNSNIKIHDCSRAFRLWHTLSDYKSELKWVELDNNIQPAAGWYRRLHLPFPVYGAGEITTPDPHTKIINIDSNQPLLNSKIFDEWKQQDFFNYIIKPSQQQVQVNYNVLPADMPKDSEEVYIEFKNETAFVSIMSSPVQASLNFATALKGFNSSLIVKAGKLPTPKELDTIAFPYYDSKSLIETYLLDLFPVFQKIFPNAKGATISIKNRITATLLDGSLYTTASNPLLCDEISFKADGITVKSIEGVDWFSLAEVLNVISMKLSDITSVQEKHPTWSILSLLCNKDQLRQRFIQMGLVANDYYEINMDDPLFSKFKEIINSTPFKIFCGIFITLFTIITATTLINGAYGLYQLFASKEAVVDGKDIYYTPQANDWFDWADEVEDAIERGELPPDKKLEPIEFGTKVSKTRTLEEEDYEAERKQKRTNISKKYGGYGYLKQDCGHHTCDNYAENIEMENEESKKHNDDVKRLTPQRNPKIVKAAIKATEIRAKHVNRYVSQMIRFETATLQTPKSDFKVDKIIQAQCRVNFANNGLLGCFIGENYVATCAHIIPKKAFEEGKPLFVTELVDGVEVVWQAKAIYHGFRNTFRNKFTDLLILYIQDPKFQPKPNLLKYMKTVDDFVAHEANKDILNTAVCYLTGNLKREILLETRIGTLDVSTFENRECNMTFNTPLLSHELNSNQGISNLYTDTFVPGSCGLIVYTREEPSGNGWICGMHAAIDTKTKDVDAFPLYKDQICYIIKRHKAELSKIGTFDAQCFNDSFISYNLPIPKEKLHMLFAISKDEIACCGCFAKLRSDNYLDHQCWRYKSQGINAVHYQFNNTEIQCDIPEWWQEILSTLVRQPKRMPECAIDHTFKQRTKTPALTYMGKSWFRMPENIKPRYKLAPYAHKMPYQILKKPAVLHPSQMTQETYKNLDNIYEITYEDNKIQLGKVVGKSVQSGQIKLMAGGKTDDSCRQFFGERNLAKASNLFLKRFHKIVKQNHPNLQYRFLTDEEVINGITNQNHPMSKHIYNMDLDSEAGPTSKLLYPDSKGLKREHFIQVGKNRDGSDKYELTPESAKYWYRVRDNAKKRIITFAPDHLKLKNENLKLAKVDEGKTRAYISRDMFGMMLEKRVFGFLQGLFHMDGCQNFSAIGCNHITDYPKLLQRFKDRQCTNLICYDVKRWDKNTLRILLERLFITILSYLKTEFSLNQPQINQLEVAFAQILTTYFQSENDFYCNGRSMPSGTYVTALMNTCLNEYLLCLFVAYVSQLEKRNPDIIMSEICSCFMGDDGVVAFPSYLIKFFEPKRLQQVYAEMNVELTSTSKDGSEMGIVDLMDFEFCSRTVKQFQTSFGLVTTFPLKEISVQSDSHWLTKNTTETKLSICRTKLQEACLHGPEFYESEIQCIKIILNTLPIEYQSEILILPWEEQLKLVVFSASTEELESQQEQFRFQAQVYIRTFPSKLFLPGKRETMGNPSSKYQNNIDLLADFDLIDLNEPLELQVPETSIDFVSRTQEICQARKLTVPEYYFQRVSSPDHIPRYECSSTLKDGDGVSHFVIQEATGKRKAKWMVAREFYIILNSSISSQMERSTPAANASPSGDAGFDAMITTAPTAAPADIIQPSLEQLTDVLNYGDPRELIDVIKTQVFPIRDIVFNASATPGTIIAKIPYGPDYLPAPLAEYFAKHKYFKGMFSHTLVLYSNATVTGAIRISHVKDIDKDIYTRNELVETNHSEIVQLNQVSMTSNTARNYFIDYAGQADKVLPVQDIVGGTYIWTPSRPGIVITMEVPVQQIYGQNLNLTLQHYTGWGNLVVSTPILSGISTPGVKPGAPTLLQAMQGMNLQSVVSSLEPGLLDGDLELTTDGCSFPSTLHTNVRTYSKGGIEYMKPAVIEVECLTGLKTTTTDPSFRVEPKLANVCMYTGEVVKNVGTVYCRGFVLEGDAPIKYENIKDRNSFEKCLTTSYRLSQRANLTFPFPDSGFSNTDSTIADIQKAFLDAYNTVCVTGIQTFSANPFKISSIKGIVFRKNDTETEWSLDLTKYANNINTKAIVFSLGNLSFRLYVIDIDFAVDANSWVYGYDYDNSIYTIRDYFALEYTPPTAGVSTIPLISSWTGLSRLPAGCKTLSLINPKTSAIMSPNGNEGLPTVPDTKYSAAFLQFLDVNTPKGQVCKITIMQSGTGRIVANIYYSSEYRQMFIYSPGTATQYAAFIGQPSTSFVISQVSFQSATESFLATDDTAWSNRLITPTQINRYVAQMMLATALQAGLGAVGGIASGINSAIQQQQEFKRIQLLQQERLDFQNRWNQLSAETQLKTNEITNATNLSMNQNTNAAQLGITDKNNMNAYQIAQLQSGNRIDLAKISQQTSFADMRNRMDIAQTQQATTLGAKAVDLSIAQGNNATTIEAANIASNTATLGNALNFAGGLANTGVGIAKVVTDYLQGDKERENRIEQIHVRGDETRKTIDHNIAMAGGNIAASQ